MIIMHQIFGGAVGKLLSDTCGGGWGGGVVDMFMVGRSVSLSTTALTTQYF